MAVTPRRWLALALVGCLGLAVTLLPPGQSGSSGLAVLLGIGSAGRYERWILEDTLRLRRAHLGRAIRRTRERLEVLALRDTLASHLREAPGPVATVVLPGASLAASAGARRVTDSIAAHLPAPASRVVLFVLPEEREWAFGAWLFLPGTVAGDACVVAIRGARVSHADLLELASPCVFRAAFGVPGDSVSNWLVARGFDVAREHRWWQPAALPPAGTVDVSWWSSRFFRAISSGWSGGPEWTSPGRAACQAGRAEACARETLSPRRLWASPELGQGVYTLLPSSRWWRYGDWQDANPARDELLAQLIREFGAERFARFWRSDRPVEAAFEAAFGETLGAWDRRWTQRRLGVTYSGPVIRWPSVMAWLTLVALVVGVSAATAERRQAV